VVDSLPLTTGHTPVLRLPGDGPPLWVKLELLCPTGSGKDRQALAILASLRAQGALHPGRTLAIASTGNLAVSLAWAARTGAQAVHAFIPGGVSLEFRQLLALYGAHVTLTPTVQGVPGARAAALAFATHSGACLVDPFLDDDGLAGVHALAEEIRAHEAEAGPLAAVFVGVGTGLTHLGLTQKLTGTPVIGVEVSERGQIHPVWGIGCGVEALRRDRMDEVVCVPAAAAWAEKRALARSAGLFVGPTTGACVLAARSHPLRQQGPVLTLAMDTGERTFSLESKVP
jgi:cysteine synthase